MKLIQSLLLLAISLPLTLSAQNKTPLWQQAIPRTDENSLTAHADLRAKTRQGIVDIYFQGDSITRRWGTTDRQWSELLANWNENFFGWNAGNFAWGADTVQNMLWRMHDGELHGLTPKIFVIMAGTNNLGGRIPEGMEDSKVEEVVGGIKTMIDFMLAKSPDATVVLTGITPRNGRGGDTSVMPVIGRINDQLSEMADGEKIRFINLNSKLADESGKLYDGMTIDGLHLSLKGYQLWADELKPIFTEILGSPKNVDYAPAPTGDPSARRPN